MSSAERVRPRCRREVRHDLCLPRAPCDEDPGQLVVQAAVAAIGGEVLHDGEDHLEPRPAERVQKLAGIGDHPVNARCAKRRRARRVAGGVLHVDDQEGAGTPPDRAVAGQRGVGHRHADDHTEAREAFQRGRFIQRRRRMFHNLSWNHLALVCCGLRHRRRGPEVAGAVAELPYPRSSVFIRVSIAFPQQAPSATAQAGLETQMNTDEDG